MPAFNEGQIISSVIHDVRNFCGLSVVVVDDASTDDTVLRAREAGATVIPLAAQLGAWGATQTGLRYALRHGYDVVITMDADGQHEAESLNILLDPVRLGEADVSIGACTSRGSMLRRVAWNIMRKVSGLTLEDITSGLRVYNLQAVIQLAGWRATMLDYQDIGVLLTLQSRGLRIVDREVNMSPRINGVSRVFNSWLMVAYYMCHTMLLSLSKRKVSNRIKSSIH